jgi:hypothetical protein
MSDRTSLPGNSRGLRWFVAGLFVAGVCLNAGAAISKGPVSTNATEEEVFEKAKFDAYQSLRKKARVAEERSERKEAYRNQIVEGMTEERESRERMITAPATASPAETDTDSSVAERSSLWILAVGLAGLAGYRLFLGWATEESEEEYSPTDSSPARNIR